MDQLDLQHFVQILTNLGSRILYLLIPIWILNRMHNAKSGNAMIAFYFSGQFEAWETMLCIVSQRNHFNICIVIGT